jgi:hypothetical protein
VNSHNTNALSWASLFRGELGATYNEGMKQKAEPLELPLRLRRTIEREARTQKVSAAALVEAAVREYVARLQAEDEAEQERLRAQVMSLVGSVASEDPTASSRVSEIVAERLEKKYGRRRND